MVIACIPYIAHAQAPTAQRPAYTLERYDLVMMIYPDATPASL